MEPATITLSNGASLSFGPISAWDIVQVSTELQEKISDADEAKVGLCMAWRSAISGGFQGSFQDFCKGLPSIDDYQAAMRAARPFTVSRPSGPAPSSD